MVYCINVVVACLPYFVYKAFKHFYFVNYFTTKKKKKKKVSAASVNMHLLNILKNYFDKKTQVS